MRRAHSSKDEPLDTHRHRPRPGWSRRAAPATLTCLVFLACGQDKAPEQYDTSWQAQLEALGYVNTVAVEGDTSSTGVTTFDSSSAHPGLNLFNSRDESIAKLMTMDGHIVHTWPVAW